MVSVMAGGWSWEARSWVPHSLQNLESGVLSKSHLGHLAAIIEPFCPCLEKEYHQQISESNTLVWSCGSEPGLDHYVLHGLVSKSPASQPGQPLPSHFDPFFQTFFPVMHGLI
jgi:hypothetical protein